MGFAKSQGLKSSATGWIDETALAVARIRSDGPGSLNPGRLSAL
jgi:hypothetical protein